MFTTLIMPLSIQDMAIITISLFVIAAAVVYGLLYTDAMKQKAARIAAQESARRPTLNQVTATELRVTRIHTPKGY